MHDRALKLLGVLKIWHVCFCLVPGAKCHLVELFSLGLSVYTYFQLPPGVVFTSRYLRNGRI